MASTNICKICDLLVIIGALNWGLVGLGYLLGFDGNVVNLIIGAWPLVENIVYLLVGVAAVLKFTGTCKAFK